jgi:hypothetical protein
MARDGYSEKGVAMIARASDGSSLDASFVTALQNRSITPSIIFRFATDSTTDLNEALDDSETVIDVDDSSVFDNDDIIIVDNEYMLVVDDAVGANQIQVTRGYGISIAATHNDNSDIYLFDIYSVLDVSDISIDPDLGASEAIVTLSNADQSMNIFLSDLTNHGNPARIELGISGESDTMTVFTGVIDHTEFSDRDMTCSLYLTQQSTVLNLLDQTISPAPDALDMVNGVDTNPLDFIWSILTAEGGLDSTVTQDNIDIDYTTWSAVQTKVGTQNFSIGARIPRSHTYRSALQLILDFCSCWAFITNEGKLGFAYADNDAVAGDDTWSESEILHKVNGSTIDGHRVSTDQSEIINNQFVSFGFSITTGLWSSSELGTTLQNQEATSQSDYGVRSIAEADTQIWHVDVTSATGGSNWVESIHKDPKILSEVTAWLYGARSQIGDVIDLTDVDYGFTNKLMKIMRIVSFNLTDFTVTVLMRA